MGSVLATLMRGILGVAATILVVAIAWTLYVKRDAVLAAGKPVVDVVMRHESATSDGAPSNAGRGSDPAKGSQ